MFPPDFIEVFKQLCIAGGAAFVISQILKLLEHAGVVRDIGNLLNPLW
jgi:hypothetical protein